MEPKKKTYKWLWRNLESTPLTKPALKDVAAAPGTPAEYKDRVELNLFGHKAAQLVFMSVIGEGSNPGLQLLQPKNLEDPPIEVNVDAALPVPEGMFVLDAVNSLSIKPSWSASLEGLRSMGRTTTASQYVRDRLLDVAVTGPKFVDHRGKTHNYRRRRMGKVAPKKVEHASELSGELHAVDELVHYKPPWEAVVHEKCGLYQDYYLVRWASPHNKADYSDEVLGGSNFPGCTWEPDECIPDDLDTERVKAKQRWVENPVLQEPSIQRGSSNGAASSKITTPSQTNGGNQAHLPPDTRHPAAHPDGKFREDWRNGHHDSNRMRADNTRNEAERVVSNTQAKGEGKGSWYRSAPSQPSRKRPTEAEETERFKQIFKIARRTTNDYGLRVSSDFSFPSRKHGWDRRRPKTDENREQNQIKMGWPKSEDSYPRGYGPAKPPGPCSALCDCMEDWHLGNEQLVTKEQDRGSNNQRTLALRQSLENFSQSGLAVKRGSTSLHWIFETAPQLQTRIPLHGSTHAALELRRVAIQAIQGIAAVIPLSSILGDTDAHWETRQHLVPGMGFAFGSFIGEPVPAHKSWLRPSQYSLEKELQKLWFSIDAPSGEMLIVDKKKVPDLSQKGETQLIKLTTKNGDERDDDIQFIKFVIVASSDGFREHLRSLTNTVAQAAAAATDLQRRSVGDGIYACMEAAFNPRTRRPVEDCSVGSWIASMVAVAELALAISEGGLTR